jgi:hypothetical protein
VSPRRNTALQGHGLQGEGAAHDEDGRRIWPRGIGGAGRAKCACGWLSKPLTSGRRRQAAHSQHKADLKAATGTHSAAHGLGVPFRLCQEPECLAARGEAS